MRFNTFYEANIQSLLTPITPTEDEKLTRDYIRRNPKTAVFYSRDRDAIIKLAESQPGIVDKYDSLSAQKKEAEEQSDGGPVIVILAAKVFDVAHYPYGFNLISFMNPELSFMNKWYIPLFKYVNGKEVPVDDPHKDLAIQ